MPSTTVHDLTRQLINDLDVCPLDRELKRQALMAARAHIDQAQGTVDAWRDQRAARGPVGSGKKAEAMRQALADVVTSAHKAKKPPLGRKK